MEPASAKLIAAGIAVLPLLGVGIGLGLLFSAWISAVGRNPEAAPGLRQIGFLAFALTEAIGLFALVIAFLILFVF
jgi:F-type H+-transporting ATPase subunit c